jgi:hypothetical protein
MLHEIPVCIRLVWTIEQSTEEEATQKLKQLIELSQLLTKQLRASKTRQNPSVNDALRPSLDTWLSEHQPIQELLDRALSSRAASLEKSK